VLDKPGKTGWQLEPQVDDPPCATSTGKPASYSQLQATTPHGYPLPCGGDQYVAPTGIGAWREGARNVDMARVAESLQGFGRMARPVLDGTGLSGKFDFALEWTPRPGGPAVDANAAEFQQPGPSFLQAVREQLGLKFKEDKAPIEIVVIDHIARPSEN
jgi:bla regulator protein blaR1